SVLAKLREELAVPQRKPTRIAKEYHDRTDWEVGHAVSYKLRSGRFVVMRVLKIEEKKSRIPVVELCDWIGDMLPSTPEIEALPVRHTKTYLQQRNAQPKPERPEDDVDVRFTVYALSKRQFPADRVAVLATGLRVNTKFRGGVSYFGGWKDL